MSKKYTEGLGSITLSLSNKILENAADLAEQKYAEILSNSVRVFTINRILAIVSSLSFFAAISILIVSISKATVLLEPTSLSTAAISFLLAGMATTMLSVVASRPKSFKISLAGKRKASEKPHTQTLTQELTSLARLFLENEIKKSRTQVNEQKLAEALELLAEISKDSSSTKDENEKNENLHSDLANRIESL